MTSHTHCLGKAGLAVFAATADQRYLLGPEVFMHTHSPITLRRFRNGREPEAICEDSLLDYLLTSTPASQGNRVFVLYGAAGSGKSELMRWLQISLEREAVARSGALVRVARTELDALVISEKFRRLLHEDYFNEVTHRRWQMARQKPRTLTKLVVLGALESLLDDDETINALFYRLTNVIQPHIAHCLGMADTPGPVDILSRETWDEVLSKTVLPVPVDCEILRHQMLVALQSHLLEGSDLPNTLGLISEHVVSTHNLRPLLLVDDLVQSLNLFATDLLDYFVTLESGQWDVVLGLTPAAFETTQRGRELLQRIAYLDTLDDRVTKLWLSDDAGTESYFLNESNCHHFAARYLAEHRRLNAVATKEPREASSCLVIDGDGSLCPFNRELLVRVFRGLPTGKGKARYFLNALHEVLERSSNGTPLLAALDGVAKPEGAARCGDAQLARIAELYGPLVQDRGSITLGVDLVRFFGMGEMPVTLSIESLTRQRIIRSAVTEVVDDEEKLAIHDWLQGRAANRQLLKGVRRGIARWLRVVVQPDLLCLNGIAKPHGTLRLRKAFLDTMPPICLEGIDDESEGILLERAVGSVAYDLHRYAKATGIEAKQLLTQLSAEPRLLSILLAAENARRQSEIRLSEQLGMPLDLLALRLYTLLALFTEPDAQNHPSSCDSLRTQIREYGSRIRTPASLLDQETSRSIWHLWEDWFKLRENVWDGHRIARLSHEQRLPASLAFLLQLDLARLDRDYWLGKQRLIDALGQVVALTKQLLADRNDSKGALSPAAEDLLAELQTLGAEGLPLDYVPAAVLTELHSPGSGVSQSLRLVFVEQRLKQSRSG